MLACSLLMEMLRNRTVHSTVHSACCNHKQFRIWLAPQAWHSAVWIAYDVLVQWHVFQFVRDGLLNPTTTTMEHTSEDWLIDRLSGAVAVCAVASVVSSVWVCGWVVDLTFSPFPNPIPVPYFTSRSHSYSYLRYSHSYSHYFSHSYSHSTGFDSPSSSNHRTAKTARWLP